MRAPRTVSGTHGDDGIYAAADARADYAAYVHAFRSGARLTADHGIRVWTDRPFTDEQRCDAPLEGRTKRPGYAGTCVLAWGHDGPHAAQKPRPRGRRR